MLTDGDRTFTWDADKKPTASIRAGVGTTYFFYNGDGARVKMQGPAGVVHYAGGLETHFAGGLSGIQHITGDRRHQGKR